MKKAQETPGGRPPKPMAGIRIAIGEAMTQEDKAVLELAAHRATTERWREEHSASHSVDCVIMTKKHGFWALRARALRSSIQLWPRTGRLNISRPPGSGLIALADFFCSPKTMERVVGPTISDLRQEYFEALKQGRRAKAEWCRVRGCWSFFKAVGLNSLLKAAVELLKKVTGS